MDGMLRTTFESLAWAGAFLLRHPVLVIGLGAVAAGSRAAAQLWDGPPGAGIGLELLTWASRVVLVAMIVRIGIVADPAFSWPLTDQRVTRFLEQRWPSLVLDSALLLLAAAVFTVPEHLGPAPGTEAGRRYWAVLLAAKNLTVIPLTLLWITSVARQAVLHGAR